MTMITGYQWGDTGAFIGIYEFPNNLDQNKIHMPPKTTLIEPPSGIASGQEAAWDVATGAWIVRAEDLTSPVAP